MYRRKLGKRMMRHDQIAVLMPVVAGSIATAATILIHSVALGVSVRLFRQREETWAGRITRLGQSRNLYADDINRLCSPLG